MADGDQLALRFLTAEQAGAIDAALAAVNRSLGSAIAGKRWSEADELERIGRQLVDLLTENSSAVRADHPTHPPAASPGKARGGRVDQESPAHTEHSEPRQ
jgi:hypothetical protein